MAKQEYEGIAFTSALSKDGWQVSVTERASSSAEAVANLEATISLMIEDGYVPFVTYYNKAVSDTKLPDMENVKELPYDEGVVATAQELGGVVVPEGHRYLGVKPGKLEEILENDSYQVMADSYSYDGTWVNFYYSDNEMSVAGHYYATKVGAKIFNEMFHWQPVLVDKAPLPGGDVMLYILGVKGKKSTDIYQNIKDVTPA